MTAVQWGSVAPAAKGGLRRGGAARKMIPPNKVISNSLVWHIFCPDLINATILLDVNCSIFVAWDGCGVGQRLGCI